MRRNPDRRREQMTAEIARRAAVTPAEQVAPTASSSGAVQAGAIDSAGRLQPFGLLDFTTLGDFRLA